MPIPSQQLPHTREDSASWGAPFFFGVLLIALGVYAFIATGVAGLASVLTFGWLIVLAGIIEIGAAWRYRKSGLFASLFLGGILSLAVGVVMLWRPMAGLGAITLLLGGYFLVSGAFHGLLSIIDRYPGWGVDLVFGIVSLLAGYIVLRQWPGSSLWVVGTLVGAVLVVRGVALSSGALALRRALHAQHI
jgi:uncharacterized membrane protein HdeD (DUF308 family)